MAVLSTLGALSIMTLGDPKIDGRVRTHFSTAPSATNASELLAAAKFVRNTTAGDRGSATAWTYVDIDGANPHPALSDMWFAVLVGEPDLMRLESSGRLDDLDRFGLTDNDGKQMIQDVLGPVVQAPVRFDAASKNFLARMDRDRNH